jgi:hypothetical protein
MTWMPDIFFEPSALLLVISSIMILIKLAPFSRHVLVVIILIYQQIFLQII